MEQIYTICKEILFLDIFHVLRHALMSITIEGLSMSMLTFICHVFSFEHNFRSVEAMGTCDKQQSIDKNSNLTRSSTLNGYSRRHNKMAIECVWRYHGVICLVFHLVSTKSKVVLNSSGQHSFGTLSFSALLLLNISDLVFVVSK